MTGLEAAAGQAVQATGQSGLADGQAVGVAASSTTLTAVPRGSGLLDKDVKQ